MPAFDLVGRTTTLSRFDVVGEHSATSPGFVRHVALFSSSDRELRRGDLTRVVHMGPPLDVDGELHADVAGAIPLTNAQVARIATWIKTVDDEYRFHGAGKRQQYTIDPPWVDVKDGHTGVRRYRRYSCAGFVLDAHGRVGVPLLVIDRESLPAVTKETIETAYPAASEHPGALAKSGLRGDGPWRIVLAGYVLNALNRTGDEIRAEPYVAKSGDEVF